MPSKLPKNKVQLNVLIDRELYEKVKRVAVARYGRLHGALSRAVEEALRLWLAPRPAHTHTNPRYVKIIDKYLQVKEKIIQNLGCNANNVIVCTGKDLRLAIESTIGHDPRTIKKYIQLFEEHGLIECKIASKLLDNRVYVMKV